MTAAITLIGGLLVVVALRDVFDTLFHPHGRGVVSGGLIRAVWRATRKLAHGNHRALSLAGPISFIAVIAAWGGLVVLGFALIFWPHLPDEFVVSKGLDAGEQDGFLDAIYVSMVNLTSLGYGDITPAGDLFRILGPLETLIGLGLLTASISWILLLYRVLSDYRSLSHEIAILTEVQRSGDGRLEEIEPWFAAGVLADLTSRVLPMRDDFVHSPIAYYFHPRDARHALPVLLPTLLELVQKCSAPGRPVVLRFQAAMLGQALEDLLSTIAEDFVRTPVGNPHVTMDAYRRDHLWAAGERSG